MSEAWLPVRLELSRHPKLLKAAQALFEDHRFCDWVLPGLTAERPFDLVAAGLPAELGVTEALRTALLRVTLRVMHSAVVDVWGYVRRYGRLPAGEGERADCIYLDGFDAAALDEVAGVPGVTGAMASVGWVVTEPGKIGFVNFLEHNTLERHESADARRRALARDRSRRYRERTRHAPVTSPVTPIVTPIVTQKRDGNAPLERREKRDIELHTAGAVCSSPGGGELRRRDELWDAVCAAFGLDPKTPSERTRVGRVVRDLRLKGATPAEIVLRLDRYRRAWPNAADTPEALLKHWDHFAHERSPHARPDTGAYRYDPRLDFGGAAGEGGLG